MKKILVILLLLTVCIFTACDVDDTSDDGEGLNEIRVASLKGPTTMGMSKLIDDKEGSDLYKFNIYGTPDEIVTQIVNDDIDIALVPCNLASVLYNKTNGKIQVAAINNLGVLYIVESGNTISSMDDLVGKKIYSVGKNATPEYALNYLLDQNKIDRNKDVTIEYKSEATELAVLLNSQENLIALLPQPYVTVVQMQNENVRIALDLSQEWNEIDSESNMVTGVLVARKQFIEENKEKFDEFLEEYKQSTEFVNANHSEAAKMIKKYGIVDNEVVAEKSIPKCNITYIDGDDMVSQIQSYLSVLFNANPQSIGGEMPEDDFYYQK